MSAREWPHYALVVLVCGAISACCRFAAERVEAAAGSADTSPALTLQVPAVPVIAAWPFK
jgi:hypothetical protein